jgi:hypothetical protein
LNHVKKETLLEAMAQTRKKESELEYLSSDIAADPDGKWHPKDHLAHMAWHRERNAQLIDAVRSGSQPPPEGGEDINDKIYAETKDRPATEVIADARRSWEMLEAAIEACNDKEWERPRPYGPPGRKLMDGSPADHLAAHLFWCYIEAGNEKDAEGVLVWARDLSSKTSSDPKTHAVATYNLACYYARTAQVPETVSLLRESFEGDPGLRDWSQKDPDLDEIRDDPRMVELIGAPA